MIDLDAAIVGGDSAPLVLARTEIDTLRIAKDTLASSMDQWCGDIDDYMTSYNAWIAVLKTLMDKGTL